MKVSAKAGRSNPATGPQAEAPGLREQNRRERMARIKQAARELFDRKGYHGTTLRAIGTRVGLGAGTLFGYVKDKRDLVWLLFNADHQAVTREAIAALSPDVPFIDQSINGFRFYYRYFARNRRFALCVLREWDFLLSHSASKASETARRHLDRILKTIEIGRARGEITALASDEELARLIFHIYQMECRRWMADGGRDVEAGLAALRSMLNIVKAGFASDARGARWPEREKRLPKRQTRSIASA